MSASRRCAVNDCDKWAFEHGFCREHTRKFAPMYGDALRDARVEADVTPEALLGQGDPGDWTCPRCTLINSALGNECAMCLAKKPVTRPIKQVEPLTPASPAFFRQHTRHWACRVCTFVNRNGEPRCSNCQAPKSDEMSAVRTLERTLRTPRGDGLLSPLPPGGAPASPFNLATPGTGRVLPPIAEYKSTIEQKSSFASERDSISDSKDEAAKTLKVLVSDMEPKIGAPQTLKPGLEFVDGERYLSILRGGSDQKEEVKSVSDARVVELWHQFVEASDVVPIVSAFDRLRRATGAHRLTGLALFDHVRTRVCGVCPYRTQQWWTQLAEKRSMSCYNAEGANRRVLIVGGSVAGLRSAIELAMLGTEVICIELRDQYRRWNVLHIWEFCVTDLLALGVKLFFPSFGTSEHQHIPIRVLQCHLLKVSLCLGVTFLCPCDFVGIEWNSSLKTAGLVSARSECMMLLDVSEALDDEDDERDLNTTKTLRMKLRVDAVMGCDGTRSAVADACGFVRKISKGSLAIGITANFLNEGTPEENQLPQLQHAYQYNRPYFNSLKEAAGVQCENLVYFRCPQNHYFVFTPSLASLLDIGVVKEKLAFPECLARDNIDGEKLTKVARQVSEFCGVPSSREFCPFGSDARPDVAIFDFSQRTVSTDAMLFVRSSNRESLHAGMNEATGEETALLSLKAGEKAAETPLLAMLAGDSLMEPFWPQGTGANRAVLSALDNVWTLKQWWAGETSMQSVLAERAETFANMRLCEPNSLIAPASRPRRSSSVTQKYSFELDPKLRYKPASVF